MRRGDPGGLDRRRIDPTGRRSGASDGAVGDQQVACRHHATSLVTLVTQDF